MAKYYDVEQQIYQILHHIVEGLIILPVGDYLESEFIDHGFAHAEQDLNLRGFLQIALALGGSLLLGHIIDGILYLVADALSGRIVKHSSDGVTLSGESLYDFC